MEGRQGSKRWRRLVGEVGKRYLLGNRPQLWAGSQADLSCNSGIPHSITTGFCLDWFYRCIPFFRKDLKTWSWPEEGCEPVWAYLDEHVPECLPSFYWIQWLSHKNIPLNVSNMIAHS